jgi:hypothetical protein
VKRNSLGLMTRCHRLAVYCDVLMSAGAALARIANQAVVFIVKLTWLREDKKGVESKGRTKLHAKASELESERAKLASE